MSSLDKSLDQIIAGNKKNTGRVSKTKKATPAKKTQGKSVGKAVGKAVRNSQPKTPLKSLTVARLANKTIDLSYATKVLCYNLPRDLKQENIKEFFQNQVGGVQHVALNYNERAQFQGTATINFKNGSFAAKAVEKYNGAPIDNGSTKLKLEIVVDTSKKPLSARIVPNKDSGRAKAKVNAKTPVKTRTATKGQAKAAKEQPKAAKEQPTKNAKKAANKKSRPAKKTAEQLDQEMTDYFGN